MAVIALVIPVVVSYTAQDVDRIPQLAVQALVIFSQLKSALDGSMSTESVLMSGSSTAYCASIAA